MRSSRRTFIQLCPPTLFGLLFGMRFRNSASSPSLLTSPARAQRLSATPACPDTNITPEQFEGPFYLCDSPERSSLLESGIVGQRMILTGQVLSVNCVPIANALVDFWQADDRGQYDEAGYRLRGHQFTDGDGRYRLETIVPGVYPGRTRHLHVKIQVPEQPFFTTQLFFPAEPLNDSDRFYQSELAMSVENPEQALSSDRVSQASFDFVLEL